jgi:hypothetical protein
MVQPLPLLKQEREDSCALACLRMVLAVRALSVTESELRHRVHAEEGGTDIEELERLARTFGLSAVAEEASPRRIRELLGVGSHVIAYVNRSVFDLPSLKRLGPALRSLRVHSVVPVHVSARHIVFHDPHLGARVLRLFAGWVRGGQTRENVWKCSVEGLRRAAEEGEKAGVVIGLQNHNHHNITATGDDVVRLLHEVDHPWCRHILDTGQYLGSPGAGGAQPEDPRRHDVYRSIARTAPLAVFVRAKLYRVKSGKEEWLDYDRIFQILRGVRYNGFVCLVYEGWPDMDAPHAVPIGVRFLRTALNAAHASAGRSAPGSSRPSPPRP